MGYSFMRMFDMSNDSSLFRTAAQLANGGFRREGSDWLSSVGQPARQDVLSLAGSQDASLAFEAGSVRHNIERFVPLYEAKMMHQLDHRWATYGVDSGESRDATLSEKGDVNFEPEPQYWVPANEVKARLAPKAWNRDWLIGWRRISGVEKIRTVIASAMPAFGFGDSLFLILPSGNLPADAISCLLASFSSVSFDFVARTKMGGTNLSYYIMQQLPVLPPSSYTPTDVAFITQRVVELSYTSYSMAPFAHDLGYEGAPFGWDEHRRAQLRAELDAWYARAYGLDRDELRYILDPADVKGRDYPSETFRVLKEKEIREFGEYRTRRLVLEAWDRMEADGTFVNLGLGSGQIADTAPTIQKSVLANLPDGAWMRATQQPNDAGAALTAILKAIDGLSKRLEGTEALSPHCATAAVDAGCQRARRLS